MLTADEQRERVFRRAVGFSVAGHLLLLLLLCLHPFPRSHPAALPGVLNVSLLADVPAGPAPTGPAAAARPKPPAPKPEVKPSEPKPAPPPPQPEVKVAKKVLPKESLQPPKPKPKPAAAPPKPTKPLDYQDALDSLRQELGEGPPGDAPDPALVASVRPGARTGPPGGGGGPPLDPAVAEWMRRVKIQVAHAWVLDPSLRRLAVQAQVNVKLDAAGNVLGVELTASSGVPEYDTSVLRAIQKATPLPPPPDSGTWPFVFTPQDILG